MSNYFLSRGSSRRMVNFDLDTRAMKELGVYPQGYAQLQKAFEQQGFEHQQGSGYVSIEKMRRDEVQEKVDAIMLQFPWGEHCLKDMTITKADKGFSNTKHIMKAYAKQRKKREREARSEQSALTEDDKRVIERIQKSVMRDEYNTLMNKPTLTETEAQKLMHTVEYFSKLGARKSDGDVAEQMTRILASSRAYDGNASGLRKRIGPTEKRADVCASDVKPRKRSRTIESLNGRFFIYGTISYI